MEIEKDGQFRTPAVLENISLLTPWVGPIFCQKLTFWNPQKIWFCDRALVFQPEIKSALTGCIPISLPSISGLEPFVEEHNKWKWKVNITKWHNGPNSSSKTKQNQALSSDIASKAWSHVTWFLAHDYVSNFFRQHVDRIEIRDWEIWDDKYELGKVLLANCRRGHFSGKVQYSIRACN